MAGFAIRSHFDLLIVDESQEGIATDRTNRALRRIQRDHTLYLSGTPFKQLSGGQFSDGEIFNWTYADEQEAKQKWDGEGMNPYERLPRLALFTYQMSSMIRDEIEQGIDLANDGNNVDYAFDLNEFFETDEAGKFVHEDDVRSFLRALTSNEKYPFSTPELRNALPYTMWYLNRVASAHALRELLTEDEVFKEYEIVVVAGDSDYDESDAKNMDAIGRVRQAIRENPKTITLTVGQLTVGVTIPEWSGVLMLCNLQSPSAYMQAAFRSQSPYSFTSEHMERQRKDTAYVFDFDPARTLKVYEKFANNLSADANVQTANKRQKNVKRLLNFFPVLGEDSEGRMEELDAAKVLTVPQKLKSREVVRRGFMSNLLFRNIANVFRAPGVVQQVLEKLTPAKWTGGTHGGKLPGVSDVQVDDDGNVIVDEDIVVGKAQDIFGDRVYDTDEVPDGALQELDGMDMASDTEVVLPEIVQQVNQVVDSVVDCLENDVLDKVAQAYDLNDDAREKLSNEMRRKVREAMRNAQNDFMDECAAAKSHLDEARQGAQTQLQVDQANNRYSEQMRKAFSDLKDKVEQQVAQTMQDMPKELIERLEREATERRRRSEEEKIRDNLRGFTRTIPSFIMAYGDDTLTLANFDERVEDSVFEEVTGITKDDFRLLRDGGDVKNRQTGQIERFEGGLFDEIVFNDSVREFLRKKAELAHATLYQPIGLRVAPE